MHTINDILTAYLVTAATFSLWIIASSTRRGVRRYRAIRRHLKAIEEREG